jgi:hypothetical protein
MGSLPLKFPNGKGRGSGYIRGVPERSLKIGSLLSDGDVLQERGRRMLLDSRAFGSCLSDNSAS